MKTRLRELFEIIFYGLPPWLRSIILYIQNQVRRLKYFVLPVLIFEGKEKNSGELLRIIYLGRDSRISSYWMNRVLNDYQMVQGNKKIPVWKVSRYLIKNKGDYDLVLAETISLTRRFSKMLFSFLLPRWFEMQINTDKISHGKVKRDFLRLIRKYSFSLKKDFRNRTLSFFTRGCSGRTWNPGMVIQQSISLTNICLVCTGKKVPSLV